MWYLDNDILQAMFSVPLPYCSVQLDVCLLFVFVLVSGKDTSYLFSEEFPPALVQMIRRREALK